MARKPKRKKRAALAVVLSIVLVISAIALGSLWALHRAYPYDYRQDIETNAGLYGLDPLMVASVIRTESSWRTGAVSSVGATGLMQIMPGTGKWIAGKNGWDYEDSMLTEGVYNIRIGCWYLDYLADKFDGNLTLALAAYNAGDNIVEKWVREGRFKNGGEGIPFPETRRFVKKVMDAYDKYKFLYH